jgi:ubiquinone/menaquinone biosynthesis C-methylase UbiE
VNEPQLDAIYEERFAHGDPERRWRARIWAVLVKDFFSAWIPLGATVLDYGCGSGEFANAIRCARRIAVDARASVADQLDPGVEFLLAEGVRLPSLPSGSIDVVFCSNLLEHLPDRAAVSSLLAEFRRILAPGGRLLLLGPNLRFTGAAYWDFFDHVVPLTDRSIVEALTGAQLQAETVIPRFLPYTTVGRRRTPPALLRIYLRTPLAWRLLGAQFFVVARHAGH